MANKYEIHFIVDWRDDDNLIDSFDNYEDAEKEYERLVMLSDQEDRESRYVLYVTENGKFWTEEWSV